MKPNGGWQGKRGTRQDRGYDATYDRLRPLVIARDKALCQPCLRKGRPTPFQQVDHIVPMHKGGKNEMGNLECTCLECHTPKTQREAAEAQGRRYKPRLEFDARGFPIWPEGR